MAKNPPKKWHSLAEKKPLAFDLVTFRDSGGKTQPGWWTGCEIFFRLQKIGKPIEYMTGPINIEQGKNEHVCNVTIYTVKTDGKTSIRKSNY